MAIQHDPIVVILELLDLRQQLHQIGDLNFHHVDQLEVSQCSPAFLNSASHLRH